MTLTIPKRIEARHLTGVPFICRSHDLLGHNFGAFGSFCELNLTGGLRDQGHLTGIDRSGSAQVDQSEILGKGNGRIDHYRRSRWGIWKGDGLAEVDLSESSVDRGENCDGKCRRHDDKRFTE